eukprot:6408307-Amphidinium_carterae.1
MHLLKVSSRSWTGRAWVRGWCVMALRVLGPPAYMRSSNRHRVLVTRHRRMRTNDNSGGTTAPGCA